MEKANILIVEDENIVALDIKATLENLGYSVTGIAHTGKEAISQAFENGPDLILMDIVLKGEMDGIEATKKILERMDIPVIFLTAYSDDSAIAKAKDVRAFGYIVKPFEEKTLNSTIQIVLQKHHDTEEMMTSEKNETTSLDVYDKKILYELDIDARVPASEIAKRLRLSKGTVNYRINKLVENGYVNRFYAIINSSLLGYQYYRILLKFNKLTPEIEKDIIDFIKGENNCLRVRVVEGAFNLILFTFHKNPGELRNFLERFCQRFQNSLLEKDTNNITKTYKYNQKFLLHKNDFMKDHTKILVNYENIGGFDADETDLKILRFLSSDARIKLIDMAKNIGVDWKVVKYRMERMKERGVMVAFTANLDISKLGIHLVQMDISLKNLSSIPRILTFFNKANLCVFAHELIGKYDLSTELYVEDDEMFKNILADFQKKFTDNFVHYDISRVYREYMINSSPYESESLMTTG